MDGDLMDVYFMGGYLMDGHPMGVYLAGVRLWAEIAARPKLQPNLLP